MSNSFSIVPIGRQSIALALLVNLIRGGNQVALKLALGAYAPFWTAFGRMAIGATVVGFWSLFRAVPIVPRTDERRGLLILGFLFTVQIGLMHYGADFTSPSYASVLMNSNPIFSNLLAHFVISGDRLSQRRLFGLVIAFTGVCTIFFGKPEERLASDPLFGNLLLLLSSILVAVRVIYTHHLVQKIEPEKAAFWQMIFSLPLFLIAGLWSASEVPYYIDWMALSGVFYQGAIVGGLAFTVWAYLLRRHTPGLLTLFNFTVPIFGVLLSVFVMEETVTARLALGVCAVFVGIWLATGSSKKIPLEK